MLDKEQIENWNRRNAEQAKEDMHCKPQTSPESKEQTPSSALKPVMGSD